MILGERVRVCVCAYAKAGSIARNSNNRERKIRTKFFCTNFLNTPKGPGHPGKIPGTSQIPLFKTQGRQTFEGGHEVFGHHPFEGKTRTPPGGLRTQKVYLCALFSGLKQTLFGGCGGLHGGFALEQC